MEKPLQQTRRAQQRGDANHEEQERREVHGEGGAKRPTNPSSATEAGDARLGIQRKPHRQPPFAGAPR